MSLFKTNQYLHRTALIASHWLEWVKVTQSCLTLCSPWSSLGHNTGVGSLSLLQGIFPTQGSNPGLLHCRWILYQLSHEGSPRIVEWVAYPFSSRSSRSRNWTLVSRIAGRFFTNWAIRQAPYWPELSGKWDSPVDLLINIHLLGLKVMAKERQRRKIGVLLVRRVASRWANEFSVPIPKWYLGSKDPCMLIRMPG